MTRSISTGTLRRHLTRVIDRARSGRDRIILEHDGEPVAAIISWEDLKAFEALEEEADARAADEAKAEGGRRPLEEVVRELERGR